MVEVMSKKVMIQDLIQDHQTGNHLIFNLVNMAIHHQDHTMFLDPVLVHQVGPMMFLDPVQVHQALVDLHTLLLQVVGHLEVEGQVLHHPAVEEAQEVQDKKIKCYKSLYYFYLCFSHYL